MGAVGSGPVYAAQAIIPAGQSATGVIDLGSAHFLAIVPPAVMTGTAFAVYGVAGVGVGDNQSDAEAATFVQINDETGAALPPIPFTPGVPIGVGSNIMSRLGGYQYIKLVSNATELAQRVIGLGLKV